MENQKVCVYRNVQHEETTKRELQAAQMSLQAVLDVWNGLDLIPCTDIFALIMNPSDAYQKAVNQLAEVPVTKGRFQISKAAYIETLDVPLPDSLYRVCRDARKVVYTNMAELWDVSGNQVVLNQSEAETLINSQNIYVSDPTKQKLAEDLQTFVELFNNLNERLGRELENPFSFGTQFFIGKFRFEQKTNPGPYILELFPDKLREWLK